MTDFRNYSPEDVICANLQETAARLGLIDEQDRAHLRELASELTKDTSGPRELIASLPDLLPAALFDSAHPAERARNTARRVTLCREIAAQITPDGKLPPEWFLTEPDGETQEPERIAYQRSSYADTAYFRFAPYLSDPRAVYTHSFPAACEEVYNGLCEYCILPLENSSEGPLSSFTRLIDRFGLRIAATADVTATDGSRTTRFALLHRGSLPLLEAGNATRYLEISVRLDGTHTLSELMLAAELCGLSLLHVNTRTDPDGSDVYVHPVLRAPDDRLALFLLYLATDPCQYETVGLYPHLPDGDPHALL